MLQNDINTKGYGNWFYFSIRSKNITKFKFKIVNMQKSYSPYLAGMKICVFSYQRFMKENLEWYRDGYNFMYYQN